MPSKQELLAYLDFLRERVEASEDSRDAQFWLRRRLDWPPRRDDRLEERLQNIEGMLAHILERPGSTCQFKGEEGKALARFIVSMGAQARAEANQYLSEVIAGAHELTICDPYILKPYSDTPAGDYVGTLISVFPTALRSLEIFVKPGARNKEVAEKLNNACKQRNIRITVHRTNKIHDRVWIADHERAYTVGTSFNGLGNRCAFILPLPSEDRRAFSKELASIRGSASTS